MASQNYEGAIELLQENVNLQDSLAYLEPPFWYYATEQTLGAAYFLNGQLEEAEQAFKASLIRHPNSAASLFGLMETQAKLGFSGEAEFTKTLLDKATRTEPALTMGKL